MERKIGEIFEYNGEWYQCVKDDMYDYCKGCASFKNLTCTSHYGNRDCRLKANCKKLKKVGEPYEYLIQDSKIIMLQEYILANPNYTCDDNEHVFVLYCQNLRVAIEIKQTKENMGDNDDIRPYDELFSPGTVSNTKYLANGDMEGMEEKGLKTKQIIDKLVDDYVACKITYDEFSKGMKSFYADGDESKPILKEFDLQAAKSGKTVCTRDGRKARILCFDRRLFYKNVSYPILAVVERSDGEDDVCGYNEKGKVLIEDGAEYKDDLMMFPEKKEGWVNLYRYSTPIYETEEKAISCVGSEKRNEYIDSVKVQWYE